MDFRKINAAPNTISRDLNTMCEPVENVYEMVKIIAKRSNQISAKMN